MKEGETFELVNLYAYAWCHAGRVCGSLLMLKLTLATATSASPATATKAEEGSSC